jgi:hypothetical protein
VETQQRNARTDVRVRQSYAVDRYHHPMLSAV